MKIIDWMVEKTNYTPPLPLSIQVPNQEWYSVQRWGEPDCFVKQFKYELVDKLLNEIQIKVKETPSGVIYSCDLLLKSI